MIRRRRRLRAWRIRCRSACRRSPNHAGSRYRQEHVESGAAAYSAKLRLTNDDGHGCLGVLVTGGVGSGPAVEDVVAVVAFEHVVVAVAPQHIVIGRPTQILDRDVSVARRGAGVVRRARSNWRPITLPASCGTTTCRCPGPNGPNGPPNPLKTHPPIAGDERHLRHRTDHVFEGSPGVPDDAVRRRAEDYATRRARRMILGSSWHRPPRLRTSPSRNVPAVGIHQDNIAARNEAGLVVSKIAIPRIVPPVGKCVSGSKVKSGPGQLET